MPSGIYLPPWLQPVDRIGPFMQGVSQGVNMARTALAAQAQAFEAQQQQQQLALRQQQEERAVATAVAGVIAQKEEQKRQQALVDMKAQQAARQFSAQMDYEQAVQSGEDPARALMRIGPRMGVNPSTLAAAEMRRPQQVQPSTVVEMGGEKFIRQADEFGREKFTAIKHPPEKTTPEQQIQQKILESKLEEAIKNSSAMDFAKAETKEQKVANFDKKIKFDRDIDRYTKELKDLYSKQSTNAPVTAPSAIELGMQNRLKELSPTQSCEVLPLPRSQDELIEGKRYRTKRGIATWDGEKFVK